MLQRESKSSLFSYIIEQRCLSISCWPKLRKASVQMWFLWQTDERMFCYQSKLSEWTAASSALSIQAKDRMTKLLWRKQRQIARETKKGGGRVIRRALGPCRRGRQRGKDAFTWKSTCREKTWENKKVAQPGRRRSSTSILLKMEYSWIHFQKCLSYIFHTCSRNAVLCTQLQRDPEGQRCIFNNA